MGRRPRRDASKKHSNSARRDSGEARRGWRRAALWGFLAALVLGATWLVVRFRGPGAAVHVEPVLDDAAARESLQAKAGRQDWEGLIQLGETLNRDRPPSVTALLFLSSWWQNLGRAHRRDGDRLKSATRTSLDHLACEKRALLFADSALHISATRADSSAALGRRADVLAGLDLPVDAYEAYHAALDLDPQSKEFRFRVTAYEAFLRDPTHPHAVPGAPGAKR